VAPIRARDLLIVLTAAIAARVLVWQLLPLDWNWDSYHHWQISWLSLKIGLPQGRLWDLNGCEYYWGMLPHIVDGLLMAAAGSPSLQPIRLLNSALGAVNAGIVYMIGARFGSQRVGLWAGLLFAVFPVAAVFDVLALQDTMALTLLLASLFMSGTRPFWSGVLLGLAGQSRTELLLVSMVVVLWIALITRFSTERLPMLIGWLTVTGAASYFLYAQTGNPLYNLYWSLYNIFKGSGVGGSSFIELMWGWVSWKLSVWPFKLSGIIILAAASSLPIYFFYTLTRSPKNYQLIYLLTTAAVSAPIFLTYVGSDVRMLLIMLRVAAPIVALGLPIVLMRLIHSDHGRRGYLVTLFVISALVIYPLAGNYSQFQTEASATLKIADEVMKLYPGGTLVCDYPMMNYRFIDRWGLPERSLLGNHYAPHYFSASEPLDHVKWLANNRVTVWVRYGADAEVVYSEVQKVSPRLLVEAYEGSGVRVYVVDPEELARLLG
jgi:hypothetical protein